jgi:hypothetical protein
MSPSHLSVPLARVDRRIRDTVDRVAGWPEPARQLRPRPDGWHAVEIVEHLVLVHEGTAAVLAAQPRTVPPGRAGNWWKRAALDLVLSSDLRVRAPTRRVLPTAAVPLADLAGRWHAAHQAIQAIAEAHGRDWGARLVFRHPLAGWLDLQDTIRFLQVHLEHHSRQLDRLGRSSGTEV